MSLLLDTGIVYAYYDRSDDWHTRARTLLRAESHGLILPAPVIPEIDHLLGAHLGDRSRLTFYSGITGGHFLVAVSRSNSTGAWPTSANSSPICPWGSSMPRSRSWPIR